MILKAVFLTFVILAAFHAESKTIRVAVIDTGFDFDSKWTNAKANHLAVPKLCTKGHYDFTNGSTLPSDSGVHGTHIASLIAKGNEKVDYCLIILKYMGTGIFENHLDLSNKALAKAIELNVDIINYSGGGEQRDDTECNLIRLALNKGIKIVAAAGNEGKNLKKTAYYPAMCDDRTFKTANIDVNKDLHRKSNYGNVPNLVKVVGTNVLGLAPDNSYAILTGTSQSAASFTSYLVKRENKK